MWPFKRHKHEWGEIDRQFGTQTHWGHSSGYEGPITVITWQCANNPTHFKQKTLKGEVGKEGWV